MIADAPPAYVEHINQHVEYFLKDRGFIPEGRLSPYFADVPDGRFDIDAYVDYSGYSEFRSALLADYKDLYQARVRDWHGTTVQRYVRPSPIRVLIHEWLHLVNWDAPEGVVDAVAADLTDPFIKYYTGEALPKGRWIPLSYPALVGNVRQESANRFYTGWRGERAMEWRFDQLRGWRA